MSFFSNFQSDRCPGTISGNPINGLCEKICIEAKKVFDACMSQNQVEDLTVTITDLTPSNPTYPLTFVSAKTATQSGTVSNLTVEAISGETAGNQSRVKCDVSFDVTVAYTDADGIEGVGTATVTMTQDVIMCVPSASIMPYSVESVVSFVAPQGTYVGTNQFEVTGCMTLILKIVIEVEILLPSYGYCQLPPCQQYSQEVCSGFFELPLYPEG